MVVSGSMYYFEPNYNFEYMNNWVNDALPCEDDIVRMDQQKIAVTMISDGIKFSEMLLPDDGIIFFAPNTAIGQKANWQCDKRATPQDASFITKPAASFFNGSNWMASVEGKETGFFLNALQVPSAEVNTHNLYPPEAREKFKS
ncbi:unnamed protein product [Anisakis simplex]|uniref:Protein amnionless n=1 Tax=Anisakis simplex TaxID=6269 RepID=A0A0M3KBF9_ANISI|nr:unnamed protein product [Anisakis simplex]